MSTTKFPRRRDFRQRAHCNPFSDHSLEYPLNPDAFNLLAHYPEYLNNNTGETTDIKFLDIGCGYGGLLAPLFPNKLILGVEIRIKLVDYVQRRIKALRSASMQGPSCAEPGGYNNISIIRLNAPRYMANLFRKGQLEKMFFLFPDPHFKKKKHKSRVISSPLLTQYAYFLKENASLYISTDVYDLFIWMRRCLDNHPLFEEFSGEEFNSDVCKRLLYKGTEESEKAKHRNAQVYAAAYHRVSSFNNPQCKSWVKLYEPDIDDCDSCPSD